MKRVTLYTDGACSGNPGPGGWAAILIYGAHELELSGGESGTTNNRMELRGVIEGLSALTERCSVELYTDSQYITDAINKRWVYAWRAKGWVKSNKEPALNVDLWQRVIELCEAHDITFNWVRGHDGNEYNERCDKLAVAASKQI